MSLISVQRHQKLVNETLAVDSGEAVVTLFCDEGEKHIQDHFAARDEIKLTSADFAVAPDEGR